MYKFQEVYSYCVPPTFPSKERSEVYSQALEEVIVGD